MSDDEADPELLALLRETLGIGAPRKDEISNETGVLKDAEFIYSNAIDVSIDMYGTKAAATSIYSMIQQRNYSTQAWSQHELHPKLGKDLDEVGMVNFVFTMDLLNFSFWSERSEAERFQVEYRGKRWTGYNSLVACLRRATDEGVAITTPKLWREEGTTDETLREVFRSATNEEMPLLDERISMLRDAGRILHESFGDPGVEFEDKSMGPSMDDGTDTQPDQATGPAYSETSTTGLKLDDNTKETDPTDAHTIEADTNVAVLIPDVEEDCVPLNVASQQGEADTEGQHSATIEDLQSVVPKKQLPQPDLSVVRLIEKADHSTGKLVNLLAKHFPSFRDEARFDGRRVRLFKRAQIFVADLWAAFSGDSYGRFDDIGHLTMFADYRVPQMLHTLSVLVYSPPLDYAIRDEKAVPSGHSWEVQLRGCSIWAVELIRREILGKHPDATNVNAVLIDFFLYDLAKEKEVAGKSHFTSLGLVSVGRWISVDFSWLATTKAKERVVQLMRHQPVAIGVTYASGLVGRLESQGMKEIYRIVRPPHLRRELM